MRTMPLRFPLIVLRHGETEYQYHSGGEGKPFYCENPQVPAEMDSLD